MEVVETAYHEAGHAVALHVQGFDVGDVSVVQVEGSLGRIATPFPEGLAERLGILEYMGEDGKEFLRRWIVAAFSGVKAVEILTGRPGDPSSPDTDPEVAGADWSRPIPWLPMLGQGEEWETITRQALLEAERILREEWANVTAIAEALVDRGELGAEALRAIFEETGCSRADALVRWVLLELERDLLSDRRYELTEAGAPEHEIDDLEQRILRIDREMETLSPEEDA